MPFRLLASNDREETIALLRTLSFALFRENSELSEKHLAWIEMCQQYFDIDEEALLTIFTFDMREAFNFEKILADFRVGVRAQKLTLFIMELTQIFFASASLKAFVASKITPHLHVDVDTKNGLKDLASKYAKKSESLFNTIYLINKPSFFGKTAGADVDAFRKIRMVDIRNIDALTAGEKTSFIKILAYLMFEDECIDEQEITILNYLNGCLSLGMDESDLADLGKEDVGLSVCEKLSTPWLKNLLVYLYFCSISQDLRKGHAHKRISLIKSSLQIDDAIFNTLRDLSFEYEDLLTECVKRVDGSSDGSMPEQKNNVVVSTTFAAIQVGGILIPHPFAKSIAVAAMFGQSLYPQKRIDDFGFINLTKDSTDTVIIFIDGFMSESGSDQFVSDWLPGLESLKVQGWKRGFNWPSSNALGTAKGFAEKFYKVPGGALSSAAGTVLGQWKSAVYNADHAGKRLANEIKNMLELKADIKFVLMGHSLGARVIFHTLKYLHIENIKIDEAYLFGGAAPRKERVDWSRAMQAVKSNIFNFYSANDKVLHYLYQGAEFVSSPPIGLGDIEFNDNKDFKLCSVTNIDVTELIEKHTDYKDKLPELLALDHPFGLLM
jgi:pimeloyl-ACP methyl ester carboxylesterase